MSRVVGVDFRSHHVRVAALKVGYRALELEALSEESLSGHESEADALRACLAQLPPGSIDTLVATVDGRRCFSHRVCLPASAKKRLDELLPFELEALLPVDIDELAIDYALIPEAYSMGEPGELELLTVAARNEHVQNCIDLVVKGAGRQPERIGCSTTELGHLAAHVPSMSAMGITAFVDLGFHQSDICIVNSGNVLSARSISIGVDGFPDSAPACIARLRQSFSAFYTATGRAVGRVVILGEGAQMSGLSAFFSQELGIETALLPELDIEGIVPSDADRTALFGRALSAAFHGVRGKGLDLRKGELVFERGYEHVKERAPLFFGLLAAVLLSFLFATWAEGRALDREREALLVSLEEITQATFGVGVVDPDEAEAELAKARKAKPEDPMPYLDGFGVAVALAETLPEKLKHDVEELDFAKGKIKLRGIVDSAEDAESVTKSFGEHRCIGDAKVTKITQVVNSDRERYALEANAHCPEDGIEKSKVTKPVKKAAAKQEDEE
jgi:Tfp pilus assembly PilM family ATPase